jgi:two-component system response regulator WspF
MRIAIVNDLKLAVEALRRIVTSVPGYEVAWVAENGALAVERCKSDRPHLVLMDLEMPVMDGVEATRRIMAESPCAVCIVTASVEGNMARVYQAMGHGARDAVNTPALGPGGDLTGAAPLLEKIATLGRLVGQKPSPTPSARTPVPHLATRDDVPPLVAIGSSTGGPNALLEVLKGWRPLLGDQPMRSAIVIVQHIDAEFAPGLCTWLSEQSPFPVRPAREGGRPEAGVALLATSNDHLVLRENLTFAYTPEPREYPYRPSVNVFFQNLATRWPKTGVAAVLTGMGDDGAVGLLALKKKGWHTIAQDERTSVIYGMPKAAAEMGGAREIVPLSQVAGALYSHSEARAKSLAGHR